MVKGRLRPAVHLGMQRDTLVSIIPAPPAVVSDLAALEAMSPIEHTFKRWGRLDELRAGYIGGLIREALAAAKAEQRATVASAETVRPGRPR